MFHWSAAWHSWQPLWWGEISFQNSRALFLRGFPFFKRINRVCRFDRFLWNLAKMLLGYQCAKSVWGFFDIPNIFPFTRFQFGNFKIDFLGNQSEYRKSLTHFCSLSSTDWHCAVCLVVHASRMASNSVQQIVSILRLKARTRLLFYQIQKKINSSDSRFISFTMIYTFLWL